MSKMERVGDYPHAHTHTHTTHTPRTDTNVRVDRVDDYDRPSKANLAALGGSLGALKLLKIIFSIVVLCLILSIPCGYDGYSRWLLGEEFTIATAVASIFFSLLFLGLYLAGRASGPSARKACGFVGIAICIFLACCWFIAGGVEAWQTTRYRDWGHTKKYRMRAAAAFFCFLNGLLYLLSPIIERKLTRY